MKRYAALTTLTVLIVLLLSSLTLASGKDKTKNLTYDKIETNLLAGLNSDNFGLSVSSAFMLGEIKSEKAILSLTILALSSSASLSILVSDKIAFSDFIAYKNAKRLQQQFLLFHPLHLLAFL